MIPLDVERLRRSGARRSHIGRSLQVHDQTASTNDLAHEAAGEANSPPAGHVIVAEHQTSGRGQRGRTWTAPARSALLFSIVVNPPPTLDSPSFLTAWAAVGIAWILRELGLPAVIKWPNDVLVEDRKISGILVERRLATVVGAGLNVSVRPEDFPTDVRLPATSIEMELGRPVDRTEILQQLLDQLDRLYADALDRGLEPLWQQWTELSQRQIGQWVRIVRTAGDDSGRLLDLRPDRGATLLRGDGETIIILPESILRVEHEEPETTS
jgi:BirA family transcriptional regulator, biotin operon repressor / biotin---[acetyl-CoA-carboxylase] ligase